MLSVIGHGRAWLLCALLAVPAGSDATDGTATSTSLFVDPWVAPDLLTAIGESEATLSGAEALIVLALHNGEAIGQWRQSDPFRINRINRDATQFPK